MGRYYRKEIVANGHGVLNKPKYFAIHSTDNPGATAQNHINYWSREPEYAVHLVSDWKECIQAVEFDRKCWHVGNGNATCIGIEICEATNKGDFLKGMAIARNAIIEVLETFGMTVDQVKSHEWFGEVYGGAQGHDDPEPYFKRYGWTWDYFIDYLKENVQPQASWQKDGNKWWYKEADGSWPASEWKYINHYWYYFDKDGYAVTGWQKIYTNRTNREEWYYFSTLEDGYAPECGMLSATTKWIKDGDYAFNTEGQMITRAVAVDSNGRLIYDI